MYLTNYACFFRKKHSRIGRESSHDVGIPYSRGIIIIKVLSISRIWEKIWIYLSMLGDLLTTTDGKSWVGKLQRMVYQWLEVNITNGKWPDRKSGKEIDGKVKTEEDKLGFLLNVVKKGWEAEFHEVGIDLRKET